MSCESEKLFQLGNLIGGRDMHSPHLLKRYGGAGCCGSGVTHKVEYGAGSMEKKGYDVSSLKSSDYMSRPVKMYAVGSAIKYMTPAAKSILSGSERQQGNQLEKMAEDDFSAQLESKIRAARNESMRQGEQVWMQ